MHPRKLQRFWSRCAYIPRIGVIASALLMVLTGSCASPPHPDQAVLANLTSGTASFDCYDQGGFEVCVPQIGQGRRILFRTKDLSAASLAAALSRTGDPTPSINPQPVKSGQTSAETALLAASPASQFYEVTGFIPTPLTERFNTSEVFSGPNCYATALSFVGLMDAAHPRHVSLAEFDILRTQYFEPVSTPRWGDLVLFDPDQSKDHVAVALSADLIFHKKGYQRGYGYRVTTADRAFVREPGEWQGSDSVTTTNNQRNKTKKYFRRRAQPKTETKPTVRETTMIAVIDFFVTSVEGAIASRQLPERMGTLAEYVSRQLRSAFRVLENSPHFASRFAYGRLISASDQTEISIEEALYNSPLAEPALINSEFCLPPQAKAFWEEFTRVLYHHIHGDLPSNATLRAILDQDLARIDRRTCRWNAIDAIKSYPESQGFEGNEVSSLRSVRGWIFYI